MNWQTKSQAVYFPKQTEVPLAQNVRMSNFGIRYRESRWPWRLKSKLGCCRPCASWVRTTLRNSWTAWHRTLSLVADQAGTESESTRHRRRSSRSYPWPAAPIVLPASGVASGDWLLCSWWVARLFRPPRIGHPVS